MDKFVIKGGNSLSGEIIAGGSKNSALGILTAALIAKGVYVFENVPDIEDVQILLNIFESLGAFCERTGSRVIINSESVNKHYVETEDAIKMRASYYLMGAFLSRFKAVSIPFPGGCAIGSRPIDQHLKGFRALGAQVTETEDKSRITATAGTLTGKDIFFDCVSVGATINVMLASVFAEGTTQLINAAKEPHVVDVANFLNHIGARISGAGTDIIQIEGVRELASYAEYSIIPDQIEVGTFMIAVAATGGNVLIKNVVPKHMEILSAKLKDMGVKITEGKKSIRVESAGRLSPVDISTAVYPGYPTDLQQPFSVLSCIADGTSMVRETIYENRFKHIDELVKMGAKATINGNIATFTGVKTLRGTKVWASDLRAGAALVIAGVAAKGVTEIYNVDHIDRGYESIEVKLNGIGANIERISID